METPSYVPVYPKTKATIAKFIDLDAIDQLIERSKRAL